MVVSKESIQIEPCHYAIVQNILKDEPYQFGMFGSRVKGTSHKCSDLDIVIFSDSKLPFGYISDLKDAFAESDLPYFVDIVEYSSCDDVFKGIIDSECIHCSFSLLKLF